MSVAEEIKTQLAELGSGSRQGHRPSAQQDFGVYAPDLRAIVKTHRKALGNQSGKFVYRVALALISHGVTECRHVA
ncbi:MAG: hypothetical protein EA417_12660 [Gammaproteobacteria bacterium]|nr:MAG: hypothetical protein EA417_12660 [Gammaproteobacteria bacterium]